MCSAQELIARSAKLGGLAIPAHPYSLEKRNAFDNAPSVVVDERIKHLTGLKALEVCNGKHSRFPEVCEVLGRYAASVNLPGIGGSDAHMPEEVGRAYTSFIPVIRRETLSVDTRGHVWPQADSLKLTTSQFLPS